jgi:hypothetical protein
MKCPQLRKTLRPLAKVQKKVPKPMTEQDVSFGGFPKQASHHERGPFDQTIQAVVSRLERTLSRTHAIVDIERSFKIKRRRIYDLMNVFFAIGCAERSGHDAITWLGMAGIVPCFLKEKKAMMIHNYDLCLTQLFPETDCVSLLSLTRALVLFFPAIGMRILDIRDISAFFSRDGKRYRNTLCKLHQITMILGAMGVIERTGFACEVRIAEQYMDLFEEKSPTEDKRMITIWQLLNRPISSGTDVTHRRNEFREICRSLATGTT